MRDVEIHMKWSETIAVEVPDDWKQIESLDDLPADVLAEIRPFDPAVESVDIDDHEGPES